MMLGFAETESLDAPGKSPAKPRVDSTFDHLLRLTAQVVQ
jgi:hypothetical protein